MRFCVLRCVVVVRLEIKLCISCVDKYKQVLELSKLQQYSCDKTVLYVCESSTPYFT